MWIAEVELGCSAPALVSLRRVQQLSGIPAPFPRLVQYLREFDFDAAAIDAPFSVPVEHLGQRNHLELLKLVVNGTSRDRKSKPFLSAREFLDRILAGKVPAEKKPLRQTERYWQKQGLNVRSTLWGGPRGGAAMTAACLQLLHDANRPIWPWDRNGRGLLIEAFPAAQLCHWGLKHQAYSRSTEAETAARGSIVSSLATRIELDEFRQTLEASADALDSVICAFAAIAVLTGNISGHPKHPLHEGRIVVHRDRFETTKED